MRPHLLFPDRDLAAPDDETPPLLADLVADLELPVVLRAMSGDDPLMYAVCAQVLTATDTAPRIVRHRRAVLADAMAHPDEFADLYTIASEAIADEKKIYRSTFMVRPESTLRRSVEVLKRLLDAVARVRRVSDALLRTARSDAVRTMCTVLAEQLDDAYLQEAGEQVRELELAHGLLVSARLDRNDTVSGMRPLLARTSGNWLIGRRPSLRKPTFSYTIAERDQAGMEAFGAFRDRSLTQVADAADTSATHILNFLSCLQREVAFYLGCVRLRDTLHELDVSTCVPDVCDEHEREGETELSASGLCDVPLALQSKQAPVPVTVAAGPARLVVLTGANRGGKSTTLRGIGVAQLMAQAGMFVAADEFRFAVCSGVFTHFKREEDAAMERGKFDEELERMSRIIGAVAPGGMLLANESFASTNEQEASDVGFDVLTALVDSGVSVLLVTHLFTLAQRLFDDSRASVFLRAERGADGQRTYQLIEAPPLPTSFGGDVYRTVFGKPLNTIDTDIGAGVKDQQHGVKDQQQQQDSAATDDHAPSPATQTS
ncbi:MutS-related protein [Flexivirga caeni]|uniref:DNA mismatch repair protein MutS n=1 Tax=Flexivirga caeni TaxID=2294115 RepID=A0A3M9MH08_9MICO|nr:DNA mismatch repair protein MutS [Flexivirga caeni]RNI24842.1 DNA mismatch repair protein MutS [Flexivirga caeni]